MRRFIPLALTLCLLGFTASAWAGPGNHGPAGPRYQQHRQGQPFFRTPRPGHAAAPVRVHRMGDVRRHQWNHRVRHYRGHRFQGHGPCRVRHTAPRIGCRSLGSSRQLSVRIMTGR